ncbi:hypothetical protein DICVIV_05076 [Dictyocaulus viviparus]|uniref:Major facilitator superfamily (MFS) profile domain-containing protein n=1 Tax=Dictyocaulus viviparus TaxID=29172 RepID=A0A0D8XW17_DICVI|nr:hypothetical protein DICVIV_05076 [Dictyocaulus viviparus]
MIGVVIGSAMFGQFSDLYGRKKITVMLLIGTLFTSLLSSFSPSMDIYVAIRMITGVFCGGLITVGMILVVENLPTKHRLWMSTLVTWAPNYVLFAIVAYVMGEWRSLNLACNIVTAIAIILLIFTNTDRVNFFFVPFLFLSTLKNAIKFSVDEIESMVDKAITLARETERRKKKYTFIHLYSNVSIAIMTLVLSFGMFAVSYVTCGLIFNLHVIQGSIFWNTALSGGLRLDYWNDCTSFCIIYEGKTDYCNNLL